jgi:hypothetical protein
MLEEGIQINAIIERISVLYDAPVTEIESGLRAFIRELQGFELVIPTDP